jgi:hypothetical protein
MSSSTMILQVRRSREWIPIFYLEFDHSDHETLVRLKSIVHRIVLGSKSCFCRISEGNSIGVLTAYQGSSHHERPIPRTQLKMGAGDCRVSSIGVKSCDRIVRGWPCSIPWPRWWAKACTTTAVGPTRPKFAMSRAATISAPTSRVIGLPTFHTLRIIVSRASIARSTTRTNSPLFPSID